MAFVSHCSHRPSKLPSHVASHTHPQEDAQWRLRETRQWRSGVIGMRPRQTVEFIVLYDFWVITVSGSVLADATNEDQPECDADARAGKCRICAQARTCTDTRTRNMARTISMTCAASRGVCFGSYSCYDEPAGCTLRRQLRACVVAKIK